MKKRAGTLAGALAATVLAACGCGEAQQAGGGASNAEATVTGKVTVKGKPATKGSLTFEPLDARGMPAASHAAPIAKDGTYTVTTKAGSNDVTIAGTGSPAAEGTYNKTTVELQPGANTKDFDLPLNP